jgi:hypothetical protein
MHWDEYLNKRERERRQQAEEAERTELYRQVTDSELQKSREEVETKLEYLKREFPDWEIQSDAANREIRRLEKEREGIILTLVRRGKLGPGAKQQDHGNNPTATAQQEAPSNVRETFVRPILSRKGWSVPDWAKESGVDFHTADDYLKGKTVPYPSTLKKLADALGVDVEKLPE